MREDSVKVASKRHESALITEQSKLIDLQTLLDSREEARSESLAVIHLTVAPNNYSCDIFNFINNINYTVGHNKRAPFIFPITLANIDGFSYFFHCYIQEGIVE